MQWWNFQGSRRGRCGRGPTGRETRLTSPLLCVGRVSPLSTSVLNYQESRAENECYYDSRLRNVCCPAFIHQGARSAWRTNTPANAACQDDSTNTSPLFSPLRSKTVAAVSTPPCGLFGPPKQNPSGALPSDLARPAVTDRRQVRCSRSSASATSAALRVEGTATVGAPRKCERETQSKRIRIDP